MFFKLVIPYYNRQFHGGTVLKWHKAPGEWVQFGDDLLDLHISRIRVLKGSPDLKKDIRVLTGPMVAQRMLQGNPEEELRMTQAAPPDMYMDVKSEFSIRLTASDSGVLCKTLAGEGDSCAVGDVVALLSTEEDENAEDVQAILAGACEFRVVPNPIIPLF